ncbi:MAG: hypothetical protein ACTS6J_09445 [Burkholderiales bacterium]
MEVERFGRASKRRRRESEQRTSACAGKVPKPANGVPTGKLRQTIINIAGNNLGRRDVDSS